MSDEGAFIVKVFGGYFLGTFLIAAAMKMYYGYQRGAGRPVSYESFEVVWCWPFAPLVIVVWIGILIWGFGADGMTNLGGWLAKRGERRMVVEPPPQPLTTPESDAPYRSVERCAACWQPYAVDRRNG